MTYGTELDRVKATVPANIATYIAALTPRHLPETSRTAVTEFVRTAVFAVAPLNKHTVDQTSAAIVNLTTWAHFSKGLPLKYRLLLSTEVICRWQREKRASNTLSEGTVRNYRKHLARIAHAMGAELDASFEPISRTARSQPYSPDELERLLLWSRTLTPTMRRRAMALLCLGAGAGLETDEIVSIRGRDLLTEGGMWVKVGGAPRLTPVLEAWRPRLRALVESLRPDDLAFPRDAGEPTPRFVRDWLGEYSAKDRPIPQRLRATWLVEMLRTEPDDAKTLTYSGIERGETLAGYLPFLGEVDRARRAALVRLRTSDLTAKAEA